MARQLELEEQLKRQENAIRLQKIKDEVEVAQLMVEAEEEEERQGNSDVPVTSKLDTLTKFLADCKLSVGKAEPIPQTDDEKLCSVGNDVEERQPVHREFRPMGVVSHNPGPPHAEHSAYVRNDAEPPRAHPYQFELPKAELTPFFGDVTDYWRFIKQFEFYVEARTGDPGQRLLYLMNYCKGIAKEEIKNCIMLQPSEAYKQARERLKQRFGQAHVIARALISEMLALPRLHVSDPVMLAKMSAVMSDCKLVLSQMNYISDVNSVQTLSKLVSKLPLDMRQTWSVVADKIYNLEREPTIDDLIEFVNSQARIARSAYGMLVRTPDVDVERRVVNSSPRDKGRPNHKGSVNVLKCETAEGVECPYCRKHHLLDVCPDFLKLNADTRWNETRKLRLCFLCLKGNHQFKECKSDNRCSVNNCKRKHHTILHQEASLTENKQASINACESAGSVQLGTIPIILKGPKGNVKTYALIDSGSDSTLVKKNLWDKVGLGGTPTSLRIRTMTGEQDVLSLKTTLVVYSLDEEHSVTVPEAFSVNNLPVDIRARSPADIAKDWPHLSDIRFDDIGVNEVGVLIGCDTPEAHWVLDQRLGGKRQPFAVRTTLGWMLLGPRTDKRSPLMVNTTLVEETEIWAYLRHMYDMEFQDLGSVSKEMSIDEKKALDTLSKGTVYENGRYTVPLPWKEVKPDLPSNFNYAHKRAQLLKKRFARTPGLYEKYKVYNRRSHKERIYRKS